MRMEELRQVDVPDGPAVLGVIDHMLMPGERALYAARISGAIYWKTLVMFIVALVALFYSFNLFIFFLAVTLIMFAQAYSLRRYFVLAATDRRVVCRAGIVWADTIQMNYNAVESVDVRTSLLGQMLGYDNIILTGTGMKRMMIPYIADADEFQAVVSGVISQQATQH